MDFRFCQRRWRDAVLFVVLVAAAARGETLTIATYNVENYGLADRMTPVGFRKDYPKPEEEKRAVRRAIQAIAADVIVLQEVGGRPYLEELRRDLRVEGLEYPFSAVANAVDQERHVALLSRRPLVAVATLDELTFPYFGARERVKRGVLAVTLHTVVGDVMIYAVHLKSRLTERDDDPLSAIRRAGEASAIRDAVLRRSEGNPSARFVILGDFNDVKSSRTLDRFRRRGTKPVAVLLPATDSKGESWTYFYRREETYSRVDHVLVSPTLTSCVVAGTARVYDGPGVLIGSDHRPVVLTLSLAR